MITIRIVKFVWISQYGTNVIHQAHRFFIQYVVLFNKIVTSGR
jgi:hypothetical protein